MGFTCERLECKTELYIIWPFFVNKCSWDNLGYHHMHGKFQVCPTFLIYPNFRIDISDFPSLTDILIYPTLELTYLIGEWTLIGEL